MPSDGPIETNATAGEMLREQKARQPIGEHHKSSATSATAAGAELIARSRSSLSHNGRFPELTMGTDIRPYARD
jgi:hypothetical protein